jgi:hypothetical protein
MSSVLAARTGPAAGVRCFIAPNIRRDGVNVFRCLRSIARVPLGRSAVIEMGQAATRPIAFFSCMAFEP